MANSGELPPERRSELGGVLDELRAGLAAFSPRCTAETKT